MLPLKNLLTVGILNLFFVNFEDFAQHIIELIAALHFREKVFFSLKYAPHGLISLFPFELPPQQSIILQFQPRSESENDEHS